ALSLPATLTALLVFFLLMPPPPRSTLFPYTTLFRSGVVGEQELQHTGDRLPERQRRRQSCPLRQVRVAGQLDRAERVDGARRPRSEEHTSELQSQSNLVCRLLLEKKKKNKSKRRKRT